MYAACTLGAKVDVGWSTRCGSIAFFLTMEDKFRLFTITSYYYRVAANQVMVVDRRAVRIQDLTSTTWVYERYSDNRVYTKPYLRGCLASIQLGSLRPGLWACGDYWYNFKRYYW